MRNKTFILPLLVILCLSAGNSMSAQNDKETLKAYPQLSAGYYRSYDVTCADTLSPSRPEGWTPFYISHYGRHGSRWHSSERKYLPVLSVLEKAEEQEVLTAKGRELLEKMRIISADAEGRYGELTPRGEKEHRGIAGRMYLTYPEVFQTKDGKRAEIDSKSTTVVRCILSMAAFNERLKELNPDLNITRESSRRNMWYIGNRHESDSLHIFQKAGAVSDSLRTRWIHPERFLKSIFTSRKFVRNEIRRPQVWMYDVFQIAGGMGSVEHLGIDLYEYFTPAELYDLWKCINVYAYMTMGPSLRFGDSHLNDAKPLLRDIITTADAVIGGEKDLAASLRFGHDSNIIPLLSLIGEKKVAVRTSLENAEHCWNLSEVSPMATNLQFIFFRKQDGCAAGQEDGKQVLVRVLYNERDADLPLEGGPFYDWTALRAYLENRLK